MPEFGVGGEGLCSCALPLRVILYQVQSFSVFSAGGRPAKNIFYLNGAFASNEYKKARPPEGERAFQTQIFSTLVRSVRSTRSAGRLPERYIHLLPRYALESARHSGLR